MITVQSLPKSAKRRFGMLPSAFHTLRLVVGSALGLYMAGDLATDDDDFYQEAWRRRITLGRADRAKLDALHPGAGAFFTADISQTRMRPTLAKAIAEFITTIPVLPVDEEAWRLRLTELQQDLESVAARKAYV